MNTFGFILFIRNIMSQKCKKKEFLRNVLGNHFDVA